MLPGRAGTSVEDRATTINGLGDVAGRSDVFIEGEQGGVGVTRTRPVLWRRDARESPEALSLAPNVHQSWAVGIDDTARVYSHTNENTGSHSMFDGQQHDFYLEPGEAHLGGFPRDVSDVSQTGLVVPPPRPGGTRPLPRSPCAQPRLPPLPPTPTELPTPGHPPPALQL